MLLGTNIAFIGCRLNKPNTGISFNGKTQGFDPCYVSSILAVPAMGDVAQRLEHSAVDDSI